MALMIAGLVLFLGIHSLSMMRPVHQGLLNVTGEIPYKIVYSLASLGALILVGQGYAAWWESGMTFLYVPPVWLSHLSLLLMLFASIFVVAAYAPGYIKRAVKHPMILSVKIWALAHLLANGSTAGTIIFGSFLVWAVADRISLAKREKAGLIDPRAFEPKWQADAAAVVVGVVVYILFVWKLHLWLIGVHPVAM